MFRSLIGILLAATLLLTACKSEPTQFPTETPGLSYPSPTDMPVESQPTAYPGIVPPVDSYPGPVDLTGGSGLDDPAYLSPQPGDESLTRSIATVEMQDSELLVMESYPVQVVAALHGYMPNPCHQLRVEVHQPDDQNKVQIDVYSVVDPDMICTEVIAPFDLQLPLGSYQGAVYQFYVNGELLGEVQG